MTTATPEADIRLDRVSKHFHEVVAVDDLSLDILRGEFFSMLGPSGCGKTTTLRMIAGFEDATAGAIYLGGSDVTNLPPFRRDVNTVFQNYALFPHLTVYDNVAFGPRRKHMSEAEVKASVGRMLDLVQLHGYDRRKPSQMSGGQQQRVALARALINHPKVLLLDEPLGALDLKLRKQMQIELKRIQTEVGITFVYVTHDQEEAMTMSDRIAVMRAGKVEQLGTPEELYERPTTEFVAGFLGISNLLEGRVDQSNDGFAEVTLSGGTKVRVSNKSGECVPGQNVVIGVRPEKLRISPASGQAPTADANALEGSVVDASYVGVSTQYVVRVGDCPRNDRLRPECRDEWTVRAAVAGRARAADLETPAHFRDSSPCGVTSRRGVVGCHVGACWPSAGAKSSPFCPPPPIVGACGIAAQSPSSGATSTPQGNLSLDPDSGGDAKFVRDRRRQPDGDIWRDAPRPAPVRPPPQPVHRRPNRPWPIRSTGTTGRSTCPEATANGQFWTPSRVKPASRSTTRNTSTTTRKCLDSSSPTCPPTRRTRSVTT